MSRHECARHGLGDRGGLGEQIGPEPREARIHPQGRGLERVGAVRVHAQPGAIARDEHRGGVARAPLAGVLPPPGALHAQVEAQAPASVQVDEHVLSARLHGLDPTADQLRDGPLVLELDVIERVTRQLAPEDAGHLEYVVALRHPGLSIRP